MMKTLRLLLIALTVLSLAACHNKSSYDTMEPAQAIEVISAKIHKDDKNPELYYDRARVLIQVGRLNDAIVDLNHAIQLKDDRIDYHLLIADAYMANGNMEKSYSSLSRALEIDPDNQEAILKQGEVSYYSRDYDRALESLSKVTERDPNNRTALFMKSFIYKEKGDTASAVQLLRRVCDIYSDYAPVFEELGVLYLEHHDPTAIDYLTTAARLDSTNLNPLYNLAMFYQETANYEQAMATYQQIVARDSTYKEAWHNMGYIELFYDEDYDLAIDHFTRALRCDNSYAEALVNRGIAYEIIDERTRAIADFTVAHELYPTFQPAIDGLSRLKAK